MTQWILVALIVAAALAVALRRLWRSAAGPATPCSDCPMARECRNRQAQQRGKPCPEKKGEERSQKRT